MHFPDYAATDRRPSGKDLADGSPSSISFLKRIRAEIDPFLKLWEWSADYCLVKVFPPYQPPVKVS